MLYGKIRAQEYFDKFLIVEDLCSVLEIFLAEFLALKFFDKIFLPENFGLRKTF